MPGLVQNTWLRLFFSTTIDTGDIPAGCRCWLAPVCSVPACGALDAEGGLKTCGGRVNTLFYWQIWPKTLWLANPSHSKIDLKLLLRFRLLSSGWWGSGYMLSYRRLTFLSSLGVLTSYNKLFKVYFLNFCFSSTRIHPVNRSVFPH